MQLEYRTRALGAALDDWSNARAPNPLIYKKHKNISALQINFYATPYVYWAGGDLEGVNRRSQVLRDVAGMDEADLK